MKPTTRTYPPSIHTNQTPDDITGGHALFTDFIAKTARLGDGDFEKVMKKHFTPQQRNMFAGMLEDCRKIGFYPDGLNEYGQVRWLQRVDHNPDHQWFIDIDSKPPPTKKLIAEMRKECRAKLNRFCRQAEVD